MALWSIDLTTHDGAESAAQMGGVACFVVAVMSVAAGAFMAIATLAAGPVAVLGGLSVICGEALVFVVAGFRLRAGKGVIWGSVAAALIVLEMIAKLVTMTGLLGLVINVVILVFIVNGVRGAFALRRGIEDADVIAERFS